jgi:tRNA A-37 threonylcarbamoyl transferase component Bud32
MVERGFYNGRDAVTESPPSFEELALRQGLITAEQLEECRRLRDKVVADGLACDVEEILLKKGYLSRPQAAAIHAAQGRGTKNAIEGYEILGKLGQGGMGVVYKARQLSLDRVVAIKILLRKQSADKEGVERFFREARAVARLQHPNVVTGFDVGFSNGLYYYSMEFLDGESLHQRLRRGPLPWREALNVLRQAAAALDHAHRHGLVHRDVKPGNLILLKDGTVKLADLGMARFRTHGDPAITQTGQIMGTPLYLSPEQACGEEADIRSDLYSLGVTFYEMLKGEPPYRGENALAILQKHVQETVRWEFPDAPPGLLAVGQRLTERDRRRRTVSPDALLKEIEAFEKAKPAEAKAADAAPRPKPGAHGPGRGARHATTVVPRRARSPLPLVIGAGSGTLALALVGLLAFPGRKEASVAAPSAPSRKAPARPEPGAPPDRPLEDEKPLTEGDRAALDAFRAARNYERQNPDDAEEIAAQYADVARQSAGTAYADRARARAEETRALFEIALERGRKRVRDELQPLLARRAFGAARELLDKHARDFKDPAWGEFLGQERTTVENGLLAAAVAAREASFAAESRGDFAAAEQALRELAALGVPELAAEAAQRLRALGAARSGAAARPDPAGPDPAPRSEARPPEARELFAFFDQAERWARQRKYEKIEPAAPKVQDPRAQELLRRNLAAFRGAHEVVTAAKEYANGRRGQVLSFETRGGSRVSGVMEGSDGSNFLVGSKAYGVHDLSTTSVIDFYRAGRGAAARPEPPVWFAILDGNLAVAEELLKKGLVELPLRVARALRRMQDERDADAMLKDAERARKEDLRARLQEVVDKYPESRAAAAARKKMESLAEEVVVYAADLPHGAFNEGAALLDSPESPGRKRAGTPDEDEGTYYLPPEET